MNETLDSLPFGDLRLYQARKGYRYSLDPVLLARFVTQRNWRYCVDLGTGVGILPLILAQISTTRKLTGIELQPAMAERARRNVLLNQLAERIDIHCGDVRQVGKRFEAGCADLVVSNPPFRALGSGRIAPDDERAIARHETAGGLEDFVAAAAWLLAHGGCLAMVHLAERLPQLMTALSVYGIELKRLRMVHAHDTDEARLCLIEGRKGGRPGLKTEPPLILYRGAEGRDYTDELLAMYEMERSD